MRSSSRLAHALVLSVAMVAGTRHLVAEPLTYQGRLTETNLPANGSYDMVFRVYTAATGGTLLATAPMVTVSALDGLIIATPDFPVGTFTGATVYLDIYLRHSGPFAYTRLGQRQPITPTPLAMRSLNERWSPLFGTSALFTDEGITNVVINDTSPTFGDTALMVTSARGAGAPGGMYVNTAAADGLPYYGWSANRVSLAEARVEAATSTFILRSATSDWLRITSDGRVGIGTTATANDRLRVNGNIVALGQLLADDLVASDDVIATDTSYANTFGYSTPKTRSISIPPEAFHAALSVHTGRFGGVTGLAYLDESVLSGVITAGVYLPDGATVVGFDAYVVDNSAAANLSIILYRRANSATAYQDMAVAESAGASASVVTLTDNTISNAIVDTDNYCYHASVYCDDWQGSLTHVKAVRIRYTVPGPD